MADLILKAEVTKVAIGSVAIEGLMDENGGFHVGIPQMVALDLVPPNRSQKQLESLLGIEFQSHFKLRTKLNPKAINAISLKDFERSVAVLAFSGNESAKQFVLTLFGLSLHQLFSDAFGIKFEADDRQAWLKTRMSGMSVRKDLGDSTKAYILRHPELSENAVRWMYKLTTDAVYKVIFDRNKKKLTSDLQADPQRLRDSLNAVELKEVERMEETVMRLIDDQDMPPLEAVVEAAKRTLVKKFDRVVSAV